MKNNRKRNERIYYLLHKPYEDFTCCKQLKASHPPKDDGIKEELEMSDF